MLHFINNENRWLTKDDDDLQLRHATIIYESDDFYSFSWTENHVTNIFTYDQCESHKHQFEIIIIDFESKCIVCSIKAFEIYINLVNGFNTVEEW